MNSADDYDLSSSTERMISADDYELLSSTEKGNPCKNNQQFDGEKCLCEAPLTGQYCEIGPRDCNGITTYGWFNVYPEDGLGAIKVYCWYEYLYFFAAPINGLTSNYLNRPWLDYKIGFGDIEIDGTSAAIGGYWLGNDKMHRITGGKGAYKLRYTSDESSPCIGDYENFRIDEENKNYTAHYSSFTTGSGLDQTLQTGCPFRAFDKNDNGCASAMHVGFWFDDACMVAPPLFGTVSIGGSEELYTDFWACMMKM